MPACLLDYESLFMPNPLDKSTNRKVYTAMGNFLTNSHAPTEKRASEPKNKKNIMIMTIMRRTVERARKM